MAKTTRRCADCKADISNRGNKSIRCKPCQAERKRILERDHPGRSKCLDDDGTCSASRLKRGRCSRHYYTARRDNGWTIPQQPRACAICGTVFTPIRSDAVCCSDKCNWRRQDAARVVDHPERTCPTCGQQYKPKKVNQRFCSIDCNVTPGARNQHRWRIKNRHVLSNHRHLRRERLYGNPESVGVSERDWERLVARYQGRCAYCGVRPDELTMDHVVPAARGGRHSIGNILPACRSCNGAKHALLLIEFKVRRGMVRLRDLIAVEAPTPIGGPDVFAGVRYEQLALPLGIGG